MFARKFEDFSFFNAQTLAHIFGPDAQACAEFSLVVYGDCLPFPSDLPPAMRWELLCTQEFITGYKGACYVRKDGAFLHVVVAHRGTVLNQAVSTVGSFIADFNVMLGKVPTLQLASANEFLSVVDKKLYEKFKDAKIQYVNLAQTGHSLGAIIADLTCGEFNSRGLATRSLTFENPGSKSMMLDLLKKDGTAEESVAETLGKIAKYCKTYLAGVNIINTCNEQMGEVGRLANLTCDYFVDPKGPYTYISPSYFANFYYFMYSVFDQHNMEKIYNYIKKTTSCLLITDNPVGFRAGYVEYLDGGEYWESAKRKYWDNYFQIIWDRYPTIREQYHNNFERYMDFCRSELRKTRELAKTSTDKMEDMLASTQPYPRLDAPSEMKALTLESADSDPLSANLEEAAKMEAVVVSPRYYPKLDASSATSSTAALSEARHTTVFGSSATAKSKSDTKTVSSSRTGCCPPCCPIM
jgi:hypothetical protein